MAELQAVSDSDSDDEFTEWFEDEVEPSEGERFIPDTGDDACTRTFAHAFLANHSGEPGVVTELYDSGASRHMTPHRSQLLNFVRIEPKTITAADQGKFQAVG
jgi:hypothetical protein